MKKDIAIVVGVALVVAGAFYISEMNSETADNDMGSRIAKPQHSATYSCADGRSLYAGFNEGMVALALDDGREVTLEQTVSASGVKYQNETGMVFFTKELGVFLEENGVMTYKNCAQEPGDATEGLIGNEWVWLSATYDDGRTITPPEGRFSVAFDEGGRFSATTDCNGIGGTYTADANRLSFREMMMTQMYCEGSMESEFGGILQNTQSYFLSPQGNLVVELTFDGGTALFRLRPQE